jgi:hypothetical protein
MILVRLGRAILYRDGTRNPIDPHGPSGHCLSRYALILAMLFCTFPLPNKFSSLLFSILPSFPPPCFQAASVFLSAIRRIAFRSAS